MFLLIGDVVESEGVGQPEGRHVAEVVEQQREDEYRGVAGELRDKDHHATADEMEGREDFFSRKESIRHQSESERRDDRGERIDGVRPMREIRHAVSGHVDGDGGKPTSPDEELEKHHGAEASGRGVVHGQKEGQIGRSGRGELGSMGRIERFSSLSSLMVELGR